MHTKSGLRIYLTWYTERHEPGANVQTETIFSHALSHEWKHGLGETVTALLATGMRLTGLTEHDSVPW